MKMKEVIEFCKAPAGGKEKSCSFPSTFYPHHEAFKGLVLRIGESLGLLITAPQSCLRLWGCVKKCSCLK